MRYFKTLWLTIFMSVFIPLVPESNFQTSALGSYRNNPGDITQSYEVAIPFIASYTTTLTYRYTVYNSANEIVYTQPSTSTRALRNVRVLITYRATAGKFTVGQNRIILYYKTSSEAERRHYSYFYGYQKGVNVNLNNGSAARQLLEAEVCYLYDSTNRSDIFRKMSFSSANLTPIKHFNHDLYFDFSGLFLSIGVLYDNENFYSSAALYCSNPALFPYLANVGGRAMQYLNLTRAYNRLVTSVKTPLFVRADTLQIARSKYSAEYLNTDTYFFPKYHFDELQNTKFTLEIKDFSYSKFNLKYEFTIQIDHPYFGTSGEHEVIINRY
ncbi:MAG: hypothetical protein ACOX3B_03540 [Bacilli bacterium]|nr:MAG: hypothetical protein EWM49_01765 [Bacillota bacterium]HPY78964.1 hypothetical protein [Bacilli bacterium]